VSPEITGRLRVLGIEVAAQSKGYGLCVRGNCVALVHTDERGVASIGSSGIMTGNGIAYLVWRDGRAMLAAHGGSELPAAEEQSEAIRRFSEDLAQAFGTPEQTG
jgi:hypothetical protein